MIGGARIRGIMALAALWAGLAQGCSPYEWRHENQWESRDQIWLSEASQVKIRAAQSRVFETADRLKTLQAVVSTFQDLGFTIEVSDEVLNIVSGRRFAELEGAQWWSDPTYYMYRDDGLLLFTRQYHSWGPFYHRSDLVRLTATVRPRGETQVVVRASAQYYLGAVENPEPYQRFFRTLEQALFLQANAVQ
jgi:hypothetical protein